MKRLIRAAILPMCNERLMCRRLMSWLHSFMESAGKFPISWVDFLTLLVVLVGFVRGRKRGLSEEMLDTLQWILIIVAGAFLYHKMGDLLAQRALLSRLAYYMMSYITIALVIKLVFVLIKKRLGQKLIEGDIFGRFEFYGGMMAGAVRFTCVYLFALSLLHAPYYSPEYWAQRAKEVDYNYGSDFFPHPCKIQRSVFQESFTGKAAEKYLGMLLIEQTSGESRALRDDRSLARRNERQIDAIMGGK